MKCQIALCYGSLFLNHLELSDKMSPYYFSGRLIFLVQIGAHFADHQSSFIMRLRILARRILMLRDYLWTAAYEVLDVKAGVDSMGFFLH